MLDLEMFQFVHKYNRKYISLWNTYINSRYISMYFAKLYVCTYTFTLTNTV